MEPVRAYPIMPPREVRSDRAPAEVVGKGALVDWLRLVGFWAAMRSTYHG